MSLNRLTRNSFFKMFPGIGILLSAKESLARPAKIKISTNRIRLARINLQARNIEPFADHLFEFWYDPSVYEISNHDISHTIHWVSHLKDWHTPAPANIAACRIIHSSGSKPTVVGNFMKKRYSWLVSLDRTNEK